MRTRLGAKPGQMRPKGARELLGQQVIRRFRIFGARPISYMWRSALHSAEHDQMGRQARTSGYLRRTAARNPVLVGAKQKTMHRPEKAAAAAGKPPPDVAAAPVALGQKPRRAAARSATSRYRGRLSPARSSGRERP